MTTIVTVKRIELEYFRSLVRQGVVVVTDRLVNRERAMEIVTENPEGVVENGRLDFGCDPVSWVWRLEVDEVDV